MSLLNSQFKGESEDVLVVSFEAARLLDDATIQRIGQDLLTLAGEAKQGKMVLNFGAVKFMSSAMIGKIIASENFHAAYMTLRQLRFSYLDLAWHAGDPGEVADVTAFEAAAVAGTDLFPPVPGTNFSCTFEHIFSGGYSAGYYSYKWAEVLSADAYAAFEEAPDALADTGARFRREILARGGSRPALENFKAFRGREPSLDALLRHQGMA